MPTQHKNIANADLHETKGVSTASAGQLHKAVGDGTGTWGKANEVDNMDYSVKAKNRFGWADISDSLYTSASPRSITSGTRTQITIDGLASQTDTSRLSGGWDGSQFLVDDLNAMYVLRVQFKCKAAAAAGTPYIALLEIESANGPTVIAGSTQFIKGGNYTNLVSATFPIYIGSFINNQALKMYITPDTAISAYDFGVVLQRTYYEK